MKQIETRIQKLEQNLKGDSDEIFAIFRIIFGVENGNPVELLPLLGWRYYRGMESVNVMRLAGEADEELEERAIALARQHMEKGQYAVRLTQIYE